jgi:hypothetical protein
MIMRSILFVLLCSLASIHRTAQHSIAVRSLYGRCTVAVQSLFRLCTVAAVAWLASTGPCRPLPPLSSEFSARSQTVVAAVIGCYCEWIILRRAVVLWQCFWPAADRVLRRRG